MWRDAATEWDAAEPVDIVSQLRPLSNSRFRRLAGHSNPRTCSTRRILKSSAFCHFHSFPYPYAPFQLVKT